MAESKATVYKDITTKDVLKKTRLFYQHYLCKLRLKFSNVQNRHKASGLATAFLNENTPSNSAMSTGQQIGALGGSAALLFTPAPGVVATASAHILFQIPKSIKNFWKRAKAKRIYKTVSDEETLLEIAILSGLALMIMYEQQIAMMKNDIDIQSLAEYAVSVTMEYMEMCDTEFDVNTMISFFTDIANHKSLWKKIKAKKIKTISGKKCNILHMFTRPGERKTGNGKVTFSRQEHSKPEKYGYRSDIIQWPKCEEVQNEGSPGTEGANDIQDETQADMSENEDPEIEETDNNQDNSVSNTDSEDSDDEDTDNLQTDNQGNTMEDDLYQPRFVIVREKQWNEFCDQEIYRTKSFNEYIRDFYEFGKDVVAVFQPMAGSSDIELKLPLNTDLDFSGTIMPFFQSNWLRGPQIHDTLDMSRLNLNGSILDKSNLEKTRVKIINGCSMNFSILDDADLSEFTGSIYCMYPHSGRRLKLTTETRKSSTILGLDESVIDVKPYLGKVGDEIKDHTTEVVQSGMASVNEHVEEAKEMLSQLKIEQRSMKNSQEETNERLGAIGTEQTNIVKNQKETKEVLGEMNKEKSETKEVLGEMKAEQKNMKECLEETNDRLGGMATEQTDIKKNQEVTNERLGGIEKEQTNIKKSQEETNERLGRMETEQTSMKESLVMLSHQFTSHERFRCKNEEFGGISAASEQVMNGAGAAAASMESGFETLTTSDLGDLSRPAMTGEPSANRDYQDSNAELHFPSQVSSQQVSPQNEGSEARMSTPGNILRSQSSPNHSVGYGVPEEAGKNSRNVIPQSERQVLSLVDIRTRGDQSVMKQQVVSSHSQMVTSQEQSAEQIPPGFYYANQMSQEYIARKQADTNEKFAQASLEQTKLLQMLVQKTNVSGNALPAHPQGLHPVPSLPPPDGASVVGSELMDHLLSSIFPDGELRSFAKEINMKWKRIATFLGYNKVNAENLADPTGIDEESAFNVLVSWRDCWIGSEEDAIDQLCKACEREKLGRVVYHLKKKKENLR